MVLKDDANVFITCVAGTGKSFVIKFLIQEMDRRDIVTGVTASTGAAADIIGDSTLQSWAGIRLEEGSVHELFQNSQTNSTGVRVVTTDGAGLIL